MLTPTSTNGPLTLTDARLSFTNGLLTYTPGTNEFLGAAGETVTVQLAAADTLGSQTTNFTWSFQLELPPVANSNLVFIGGGGATPQSLRATQALVPQTGPALTFVSSNGNTFTYTYPGASSGVTNGLILVNSSLQSGYTVVVTNFTEYAVSNTVVVITRPARLAELLEDGSLVSQTFTEITTNGLAPAAVLAAGLPLNYHQDLRRVLYQDANVTLELLPGSVFDWNGRLDLGVNIRKFRLREFETTLSSSVNCRLEARVTTTGTLDLNAVTGLINPVRKTYGTLVAGVPVWVELVFEIDAGYTMHLEGAATYTHGFVANKEILVGRRWSDAEGWSTPFANPPPGFVVLGPTWAADVSGNLRLYLQPKVTVYLYSAAGITGDLQPYLVLDGSAQANPGEASFDLALYGGLTSTVGLDLRVWDDAWGEQPTHTFDLIPRTVLWQTSGSTLAPQITEQPLLALVPFNTGATFFVVAKGAPPLSYRWLKDDRYLSDDWLIIGSRTATLRVRNAKGVKLSDEARLDLHFPDPPFTGMAYIPAGTFRMGDALGDGYSDELPVHSVYVSGFYMDRTEVTKALWDSVYNWAIAHGYSFEYGAVGKAANHPAHTMTWYDAVKWCNARSEQEGRTPAYYTSAAQTTVYRSGQVNVDNTSVEWSSGYRLPTEAEWEKAARGGLSGQRFPWGSTISHGRANYRSHWSGGRPYYAYDVNGTESYHPAYNEGVSPYTSPVGSFAANGYGLYDMAGNVWEWCWDWYGSSYYSASPGADPADPGSGSARVLRGGGWRAYAFYCRKANRFSYGYPTYG